METAALVPVKAFATAKARLAGALSDVQRRELARSLASGVIDALAPIPVYVACDDERVAAWAEESGAAVLWGPGLGLNGAIDAGIDTLRGKGVDYVIVAHGDLPRPESLRSVVVEGTIVIVPDGRRDGTNVLARPTAVDLPAEYGAGSFDRHLAAAMRTGIAVEVRHDPRLAVDIDTIDDCRHPLAAPVVRPVLGSTVGR